MGNPKISPKLRIGKPKLVGDPSVQLAVCAPRFGVDAPFASQILAVRIMVVLGGSAAAVGCHANLEEQLCSLSNLCIEFAELPLSPSFASCSKLIGKQESQTGEERSSALHRFGIVRRLEPWSVLARWPMGHGDQSSKSLLVQWYQSKKEPK